MDNRTSKPNPEMPQCVKELLEWVKQTDEYSTTDSFGEDGVCATQAVEEYYGEGE